jgi:hypothetical protein
MNMKRLFLTALALSLPLAGAKAVNFSATAYAVESGPNGVAAADLNGDGWPDLICSNFGFRNAGPGVPGGWHNTLTVLTNNGTGGFGFHATFTVGVGPTRPIAVDLNGDGQPDLVCANNTDNTLTVLTNGGGHFGLQATLPVGLMPSSVAAVDTAGLGRMDLVCANNGANTLTVLTNDGTGALSLKTALPVGNRPFMVITLEANGDGRMDLACVNQTDNTLTVLTNSGAGDYFVAATYAVGVTPICVVAGDLNGDGHSDLVSANHGGNSMTVLTNDGRGGFALSATIPGRSDTTYPSSVTAADVNGDGYLDLVRANTGDGAGQWTDMLTVLTNNGGGIFGYDTTLHTGGRGPNVMSADLNADGKPDLACPNYVDATLTVLLNTTLLPPPVMQGLKLHLDANNANADGSNPAEGAFVTTWRDLSGLGLDATTLFGVAPVYRTNALNGRAGVDFGQSGSDALATAFTSQFNFTNCTIFMVGNGAGSPTHVSISAPCVTQEFMVGDQFICHHSAPFKWSKRFHHNSPVGYYLQAGLFGTSSNELANWINGVFSTNRLSYSWEQGQQSSVTDYTPVSRHAIIGWRNADAYCHVPPYGPENFDGVICEVLVYDRQLSAPELDAVNFFLANKYGLAVTPIPPVLQVAAVASGMVGLQWPSTSGRRYQLQSATNLPAATWLNEGPLFPGTGGMLTTHVPPGSEPTKFFRLLLTE